ncbi:Sex-regulated protein janus-A [Pseudolycoriella hygida]|uniref:Sex-regulated protein janus-A n=1 Tax=Pseudolycoriella hygida TaxID=35572 RepID=A0A9Q0RWZ4_9DIPT|nr:Sex-regulated protein janus-A [Pseudolycoriella hygida]
MIGVLRRQFFQQSYLGKSCQDYQNFRISLRELSKVFNMSQVLLDFIPTVDIDKEGRFKYVLIKVYAKELPDGTEPSKLVVRGNVDAQWHADIYEQFTDMLKALKLDAECLGGGRIEHYPDVKKIKVYGYSQGYGKADHAETKRLLLSKYSNYDVEISDEGY